MSLKCLSMDNSSPKPFGLCMRIAYDRNDSRRIEESAQCWRDGSVVQGHMDMATGLLVTYRNSLDQKTKNPCLPAIGGPPPWSL
jgi:hypothetical protein